jgi:hypothetical protein
VELHVSYESGSAATDVPELCHTIGQPPVTVFRNRDGTAAFTPEAKLRFGRELVLAGDVSGKVFVRPTA